MLRAAAARVRGGARPSARVRQARRSLPPRVYDASGRAARPQHEEHGERHHEGHGYHEAVRLDPRARAPDEVVRTQMSQQSNARRGGGSQRTILASSQPEPAQRAPNAVRLLVVYQGPGTTSLNARAQTAAVSGTREAAPRRAAAATAGAGAACLRSNCATPAATLLNLVCHPLYKLVGPSRAVAHQWCESASRARVESSCFTGVSSHAGAAADAAGRTACALLCPPVGAQRRAAAPTPRGRHAPVARPV